MTFETIGQMAYASLTKPNKVTKQFSTLESLNRSHLHFSKDSFIMKYEIRVKRSSVKHFTKFVSTITQELLHWNIIGFHQWNTQFTFI